MQARSSGNSVQTRQPNRSSGWRPWFVDVQRLGLDDEVVCGFEKGLPVDGRTPGAVTAALERVPLVCDTRLVVGGLNRLGF